MQKSLTFGLCLASLILVSAGIGCFRHIWLLMHPIPVHTYNINALSRYFDLKFSPRTTVVESAVVEQVQTWPMMTYGSAVVQMPISDLPNFLKQHTSTGFVSLRNPINAHEAKKDIINDRSLLKINPLVWRVDNVRHYDAAHFAGTSGDIFVDLDNPPIAHVYIAYGV